jgi:hypothetical protein
MKNEAHGLARSQVALMEEATDQVVPAILAFFA